MQGGLADQPAGYLADVQRVRMYEQAKEAVEREHVREGELVNEAPQWAHDLVDAVELRLGAPLPTPDDGEQQ